MHRRLFLRGLLLKSLPLTAIAILPPLDSLAIQLFSVHMVQHELMMLVGAPLLIAGRPLPRCLAGLPAGIRSSVAHTIQGRAAASACRACAPTS